MRTLLEFLQFPMYVDVRPTCRQQGFLSWEEVGRWYSGLEKTPRSPSPEVRAKAEELTTGLNDDNRRIEALYDFAAKKIKYLSLVSLGIGGYVPQLASETLTNGYGDCKDKAVAFGGSFRSRRGSMRRRF